MLNSATRTGRLLPLAGAGIVAAIVALTGAEIYFGHQEALENGFQHLENSARIADETVSGSLRAVDLLLDDVNLSAERIRTDSDRERLVGYMVARAAALDEVRTITVTDARGTIIYATRPEVVGFDASQRAYFTQPRDSRSRNRLFVSGPITTSLGTFVLFASKARLNAEGGWEGVTTASLPPGYFGTQLDTLRPQGDGFSALVTREGAIVARSPSQETYQGKSVAQGQGFLAFMTSGNRVHRTRVASATDGIPRLMVMRWTSHPDLFVTVGRAEDDVLSPWRRKSVLEIGAMAVLVLLTVLVLRRFARHEQELRTMADRLALANRSAGIGVWDLDLSNQTLVWDDRMYEMYGVARSDAPDTYSTWRERCHPDDLTRVEGYLAAALAGTRDFDTEFRILQPSGEERHIKASAFVERDAGGKARRMIGANWDITEIREGEAALARSNAELQRFAYVASHDLQEPLRTVTNFVQILEKRYGAQLDDTAREYIAFAAGGAKRMGQLIRDLLEFSRVDSQGGNLVPVDSATLIGEALDDLASAIETSGAKVEVGAGLPTVLGDRAQLRRLFQNLIGNALKYRHVARPPEIRIRAIRKGTFWEFAVEDNGIGIDPEYWERIFVIFQRLHGPGEYEGTGIGLAVCRRIVERHRGRIWVRSEPGRGSTFFFTLSDA